VCQFNSDKGSAIQVLV